jgi:hypothetical protein
MELHHGSVSVESLPVQGCRFTLMLPFKTVTSYNCLAAMIIDPRSVIFKNIEPVARAKDISCFTVMNTREAERTHEYESPEVIFVAREDLSAEIITFLRTVKREDPACAIVTIQHPGATPEDLFGTTLLQPLSKESVDGFLEDLLCILQREAPKP